MDQAAGAGTGSTGIPSQIVDRRTLTAGDGAVLRRGVVADRADEFQRDAAALWSIGRMYASLVEREDDVPPVSPRPPAELDGPGDPLWRDLIAAYPEGVIREFLRGYRDAGGEPSYESHFVNDVIPCESGWNTDPNSPIYFGLGQFVWSTWVSARRYEDADFRDPYEQGWAVANNAQNSDPNWQWPVCWHRGGW